VSNDKSFALYALVLVSGVASVITASVIEGVTTLPSPAVFLEHVMLGLLMRASYKSFAGWSWDDWAFTGEPKVAAAGADFIPPTGATAGARG
jgi:hypothetical protein